MYVIPFCSDPGCCVLPALFDQYGLWNTGSLPPSEHYCAGPVLVIHLSSTAHIGHYYWPIAARQPQQPVSCGLASFSYPYGCFLRTSTLYHSGEWLASFWSDFHRDLLHLCLYLELQVLLCVRVPCLCNCDSHYHPSMCCYCGYLHFIEC